MLERLNKPITIAGMKLDAPIMVGAGPIKLPEHVRSLAHSNTAAIVVGSITKEARAGNSGHTYERGYRNSFSINSKGLPNNGIEYYEKNLATMADMAHDHGKPLIVSIAGQSPKEYGELAARTRKRGIDGLEINLGCPNVWKDGVQKRIASFDVDIVGDTLHELEKSVGTDGWIAIKVSPFSDPYTLQKVADVLGASRVTKAITTTNTFPSAFAFNKSGGKAIHSKDVPYGLAGLAGKALKPVGMGQVIQFKTALPHIPVIAVGGIETPYDAIDYLNIDATALQATTAYINHGRSIFTHLRGRNR